MSHTSLIGISPYNYLVPSLHPRNLQAHNTSSTSLLVYWDPVPKGHVHGILRGYRVFYKMADEVSGSYTNVTSFTESARISGLKKYTIYNVKVLALTIKGDGPVTKNISISTDEDGKGTFLPSTHRIRC